MARKSTTEGKRFVTRLLLLTYAVVVLYVLSHLVLPPQDKAPPLEDLVRLEADGQVVLLDPAGLDWFVGSDKVQPVLERVRANYAEMQKLERRALPALARLAERVKDNFGAVAGALREGSHAEALRTWNVLVDGISRSAREDPELRPLLPDATDALEGLVRLRRQQEMEVASLKPPLLGTIFWTSPALSLVEVVFWSLFGVLTNLLVNSVHYLKEQSFRPLETWVAYAKLSYGPFFSMILVMAIWLGWFDLGDYTARAYSMPLTAFVFGYASRRTVSLFDRLAGAVLGAAEASVDAGPAAVLARRQEVYERWRGLLAPATTPAELRSEGKEVARTVLTEKVREKEVEQ